MGLLHIYNTVSDEHTSKEAEGKLRDILPDYDFSKCVIVKAGEKLTPDYIVKKEDVLYIRATPGAAATVAIIAVAVAVVAAGVGVGVGIYSYKLAKEAEEKAKQAEKNAKKLAQQVEQFPFVKGASNTNALGQTIQYLFGNIYNTPYKLNEGFYSIGGTNGDKQYYNLILSAGYGKQLIQSLSIGNEKIKTFPDSTPQETVTTFDSSSLYYDANNLIEIAQTHEFQSQIFRQKVKGTYSGEEIKHEHGEALEPLIVQCADHTMKVEVCIQFNGLRKFFNNNWTGKTVVVHPYWSNDGGATWNRFIFDRGSNDFSFNSNKTLRFTATKTFSYAQAYGKNISIKLERETAKEESNSQESCYLLYYNSFCYDNKKSANGTLVACAPLESPFMENTTRIGIRIIANANTSGMLDQFNAMCYGVARTWNKVLHVWSEGKATTRNVASWLLEIMGSGTHNPSKIPDSQIDLLSFGALYEYCEENAFFCDGIITQGIKKETLISKLLLLCNADMYIDSDGKYAIAIDKKETTPVALLNAQCIKSVTTAKSLERQPDGIKASFTNRQNWQTDTMYVMRDGGQKGIDDTCTETSIEYATEPNHIYKLCQRRMRQQILQPREVVVGVGHEGDYYPLYSTVLLQLEQLHQGIRSAVIHRVIRNGDGKIIRLDISDMLDMGDDFSQEAYADENNTSYMDENSEPYICVSFNEKDFVDEENKKYIDESERIYSSAGYSAKATFGVIIQAQSGEGKRNICAKVIGFGKTRTLYFLTPLDDTDGVQVQSGNILSVGLLNQYGQFDRITNTMKITAVAADADGWKLTLKDYSDEIYEYGVIPEYKSNLTSPGSHQLPGDAIRESEERAELDNQNAQQTAALSSVAEIAETNLELSRSSLSFHLNGEDNSLYREAFEFTAALMRNNDGLTPDSVSAVCDSGAFTCRASYEGPVIFVTVESVYGATFQVNSEAGVTLTAIYKGVSYTAVCTLKASDTGVYLGPIEAIESIPTNPVLGDYFTWTGSNTDTWLTEDGHLYTSYLYRFTGQHGGTAKWIADQRIEHNASALSDILNTLDDNLAKKNAYGITFMDRLAVNTVFARLLMASQAFIHYLETANITIKAATNAGYATSAGSAATATTADSATNAGYATSAGSAATATTAGTATNVHGGELYEMITGDSRQGTAGIAIHTEDWTGPSSQTGFGIMRNGNSYFNNGVFRGKIFASSGSFAGNISSKVFHFDPTAFSASSTGYYDADNVWHDFVDGDMWFIGV